MGYAVLRSSGFIEPVVCEFRRLGPHCDPGTMMISSNAFASTGARLGPINTLINTVHPSDPPESLLFLADYSVNHSMELAG